MNGWSPAWLLAGAALATPAAWLLASWLRNRAAVQLPTMIVDLNRKEISWEFPPAPFDQEAWDGPDAVLSDGTMIQFKTATDYPPCQSRDCRYHGLDESFDTKAGHWVETEREA